jgi:hypothetical protein
MGRTSNPRTQPGPKIESAASCPLPNTYARSRTTRPALSANRLRQRPRNFLTLSPFSGGILVARYHARHHARGFLCPSSSPTAATPSVSFAITPASRSWPSAFSLLASASAPPCARCCVASSFGRYRFRICTRWSPSSSRAAQYRRSGLSLRPTFATGRGRSIPSSSSPGVRDSWVPSMLPVAR